MGNFTTVPDVVIGQSFPPSLWESAIMNNLNLGVTRQLADTTLAGSASTVAFSSIPATYAHLLLLFYARTTSATTTNDLVSVQLNGDTAADYDFEQMVGLGTSATAAQTTGVTSATIGDAVGGGAAANLFSAYALFIPHYAGAANNKTILSLGGSKWGTSTSNLRAAIASAFWRLNAAINQITFLPSAGSFATGCRFSIYGLPA